MKVIAAQNNLGGKYSPNGVSINFTLGEREFLKLRTILKVMWREKEHFFQISNNSGEKSGITNTLYLHCTATETGHTRDRFGEDFDPRLLIGKEIEVVTNSEILNKVRIEANW